MHHSCGVHEYLKPNSVNESWPYCVVLNFVKKYVLCKYFVCTFILNDSNMSAVYIFVILFFLLFSVSSFCILIYMVSLAGVSPALHSSSCF